MHSNGSDGVLTQVGSDFEDEPSTFTVHDLKRVQDWWPGVVELDIDDWTNNGDNTTDKVAAVVGGSTHSLSDDIEHF